MPAWNPFQSLSGFLIRCDDAGIRHIDPPGYLFQSLSGFLIRCDGKGGEVLGRLAVVSIPIGFSDSL